MWLLEASAYPSFCNSMIRGPWLPGSIVNDLSILLCDEVESKTAPLEIITQEDDIIEVFEVDLGSEYLIGEDWSRVDHIAARRFAPSDVYKVRQIVGWQIWKLSRQAVDLGLAESCWSGHCSPFSYPGLTIGNKRTRAAQRAGRGPLDWRVRNSDSFGLSLNCLIAPFFEFPPTLSRVAVKVHEIADLVVEDHPALFSAQVNQEGDRISSTYDPDRDCH